MLVQPFSYQCEEWIGFNRISDPDCTSLPSVLSECKRGEIFDWTARQCVSLCTEPFEWINGDCGLRHTQNPTRIPGIEFIEGHPNGASTVLAPNMTTTTASCHEISQEELQHNLSDTSKYRLEYTPTSVRFSVMNSSETYCVMCYWHIYTDDDIRGNDSVLTTSDGETFIKPFYVEFANASVAVCESSHVEEYSLLGEICFAVEDKATVIMLCLSIVFLAAMIVVYCILPILHNVPGYIILCKVNQL